MKNTFVRFFLTRLCDSIVRIGVKNQSFQSLCFRIQLYRYDAIHDVTEGLIINAAGYTHTSVSILDALTIIKIPIVELHISNIYSREEFRHKSLISKAVKGIICGFGTKGYIMAIDGILNYLNNK